MLPLSLTLITLLAAAPLLYLPGWSLCRAVGVAPADLLERHYERVAISALWSGWLALLLAELGAFSLWLHLGVTLAVCAGLWFARRPAGRDANYLKVWEWHRRRQLGAAPAPRSGVPPAGGRRPFAGKRVELIGFALVGLVALLLAAKPFEVMLGVRDAGVYANTGLAIARTGSLVQSDPLVAEMGRDALSGDPAVAEPAKQAISNFMIGQPRTRYIATRLRAAGFFIYEGETATGRVVPQGLHLLPAWIALLAAVGGPALGLFAPGLMAVLGAWSVGMLGRRLAGPWVGLLAFLFLAINGVQVWFARYSTSETVAQFLIWAGLYFFAKTQGGDGDEGPGLRSGPASLHAAVAGVAIGQVALARLDFFLLGPVAAYLGYCWLSRRWGRAQTLIALGVGAMLLHAGLHIALIARAYLFDTGYDRIREYALLGLLSLPFLTPELREVYLTARGSGLATPWRLWAELAALAAAVGGALLLRSRAGLLRRIESALAARRELIARALAGAVLLICAYGYLVRPQIIDADLLFNTRGGWGDPLARDPAVVAGDVHTGRLTLDEARNQAGVVLEPGPYWFAGPDLAATAAQRARLAAERGPWRGPLTNQTSNWLRLQGYIGAPIHLPLILWYNEFKAMSWWERLTIDPSTLTSEPAPLQNKETIPLANMVRVGWYLSPLGIILGVLGYALWLRRGLDRASWLFLAVAFVGTFFFVRQTYGTSDQTYIYILRRFVPVAYPAFCLGTGYALVALAQQGAGGRRQEAGVRRLVSNLRPWLAAGLAALLVLFSAVTNRPIYRHVEYAGALEQLGAAAARFTPGRDVLLMRGGGPIWSDSRDVPDLVATPLRLTYGLDALTVKSQQPGAYAAELAAEVTRWRAEGREVFLLLSASGASFALPGYGLEPAGDVTLSLPEFEQLTSQKPQNVAQIVLGFRVYRAVPGTPGSLATAPAPLAPDDFAAQVGGLYRPEARADGSSYAWTNGDALLRLAWPAGAPAQTVSLTLAAGERPGHLGPAQACLSAVPEQGVYPNVVGEPVDLGCFTVGDEPASVTARLDPAALPPAPGGTLLLRVRSAPWVPASEDPRQNDERSVGVQFGGLTMAP